MRSLLEFVRAWSPYVWLFGSLFGAIMSGTLLGQAWKQRITRMATDTRTPISDFWFRHGLWLFLLHAGYVVIGLIAVAELRSDWATLVLLLVLMVTPLVLVYRSYDSLRLNRRARGDRPRS